MCVPNWELQEHVPQDGPQWTDVVDQVIEVRDGYLLAPDRPGLGIELDDAGLARHPPRFGRPLPHGACARTARWRSDERPRRALATGRRVRVGLACNETVRRDYVGDADIARLEAVADFSYKSFSVASEAWAPAPRDPEAEAELARFAAGLDVLVVCHGAPFVSSEVLERRPPLTLLGELEGDRFAYRLDVEAAQRPRRASRRHEPRVVVAGGGVGARPRPRRSAQRRGELSAG